MTRLVLRYPAILVFAVLVWPLAAAADTAVEYFEVTPASISSGQTVMLNWKTTYSSGASIFLPCASSVGIHYKNQSGGSITCDSKLTGFGTIDSVVIGVANTVGTAVTLPFKLIPLTPDGVESGNQPTINLTVATDANPITDFSVSSSTVVSEDKITFSWTAPAVDRLNITLYCPDDVTAALVGDARPRVPCNQEPVFLSDFSGSGSATFQFSTWSLESSSVIVRVMPKMGSGSYDGTRSKSIQISVKPKPRAQNPIITSFSLSEGTLRPGQETKVSWRIENSVGANFKITCPNGVTATSSFAATSTLKCDQMIFGSMLGESGTFNMAFSNPVTALQEVILTLIPAITASEYDAVRARTLRISVLGNAAGIAPAVPVPGSIPPSVTAPTSSPVSSKTALTSLFAAPVTYGLKNNAGVRRLQEIMRDDGVYTGPVTGNFFALTRAAVKAFQKKYGIPQVGLVGPMTKKKLIEVAK